MEMDKPKKAINALTFGSCGIDIILEQDENGEWREVYREEGRKSTRQAWAAKLGGAAVSMIVSFVGNDDMGKEVLRSFDERGLDRRFVFVVDGEQTEWNRQYIIKESRDYDLERGPAELAKHYSPDMVEEYAEQILEASFVILISKQPKEFLTATIEFCHEHQIPTILTVSHPKFDIEEDLTTLQKCTFVAGNLEEVNVLTGKDTPEEMLGVLPNLIVTHGGAGAWFCDESGQICHEDAVPVENIVEINGAGDTLAGNFMVFHAEGKPILECMRLAMCASSIEISRMGVLQAMPTRAETEKVYREHYVSNKLQ
jgi:sugar/nucleoside kinase (ribokinase family)